MRNKLLLLACCVCMFELQAQVPPAVTDSMKYKWALLPNQCPEDLRAVINEEWLQTKAVLFVFNESLHPLGKYEFYDGGSRVSYLRTPMRMNRCTMLYIDTGLHLFHTMYQQLKEPVYFEAGKIYMARLFTRTVWPIGGVSVIKKNDKGEPVEYAAVLLQYICGPLAEQLYSNLNKKEVVVNQ